MAYMEHSRRPVGMGDVGSGGVWWSGELVHVRDGPLAGQLHDQHRSTAHVHGKVREEQFGHVLLVDFTDQLRRQHNVTLLKTAIPHATTAFVTAGIESAPIQLAQCRFPGLTISSDKILIYFSNKIHGSNFIKQHSETVMV